MSRASYSAAGGTGGQGGAGPNAELAEHVAALARSNAKLERMLAKIGTQADTPDFRDKMHQEQTATTALCKTIMTQLRLMQSSHGHGGGGVLSRLSTQFDREFRRFQSLNTQMDTKQVRVLDAVKEATRKASGARGAQAAAYDEEDPLTHDRQRLYEGAADSSSAQAQQQSLDITFVEYDVAELEQRAAQIHRIEQDVLEVSDMYRDLQSLVHEQQEHVDTIEANIAQARDKTEAGHNELLEAEEYQKKSRKKKCCMLFIVLAVVGVVVLIVFVGKH